MPTLRMVLAAGELRSVLGAQAALPPGSNGCLMYRTQRPSTYLSRTAAHDRSGPLRMWALLLSGASFAILVDENADRSLP